MAVNNYFLEPIPFFTAFLLKIIFSDLYVVSETYVVPDINGAFPTDLSDSDDDFFEKK